MPSKQSHSSALIFTVAGAQLALRVQDVQEVVASVALERTVEMPFIVEGFLALGPERIPVLKLPLLLQLPEPARPPQPVVLDDLLIVARVPGGVVAWRCAAGARLIGYVEERLIPLPVDHALNGCARWLLPGEEGTTPWVLLEMERLLLQEERARMAGWLTRTAERRELFDLPS